jgi:hypothetical protein
MTDTTPRAGAPLLAAAQAQKHVTHNEALYQFDALLCARFLDRDLSAPPASPADGDAYLVKATATGAWAGQDGRIAYCADGAWRFYTPFAGLVAYVSDEAASIVYDGAAWSAYGADGGSITAAPMLGINATADSTNKLSVVSNAALFAGESTGDGGTGDMRVMLSKDATGNTASVLYQDNFSGRAEIGLTGDDDFHFKISADGAAWQECLTLLSASGAVSLPQGNLKFPATQNLSSDPNTLDDYREGAWTPVDASGAGLSLSSASGEYTRIGRLVVATCAVAYPANSSAVQAMIGGLPFSIANRSSASIAFVAAATSATLNGALGTPGTDHMALWKAGAVAHTNADMAGKSAWLGIVYSAA